jgi:hypothetical protein
MASTGREVQCGKHRLVVVAVGLIVTVPGIV